MSTVDVAGAATAPPHGSSGAAADAVRHGVDAAPNPKAASADAPAPTAGNRTHHSFERRSPLHLHSLTMSPRAALMMDMLSDEDYAASPRHSNRQRATRPGGEPTPQQSSGGGEDDEMLRTPGSPRSHLLRQLSYPNASEDGGAHPCRSPSTDLPNLQEGSAAGA